MRCSAWQPRGTLLLDAQVRRHLSHKSVLIRRAWRRCPTARPRHYGCKVEALRCPAVFLATVGPAASSLGGLASQGAAALQSCIDPAVLAATVGASLKLFLICAAVGWLLRHNKIPGSTATVLSQVSFQLFIPAMLFSKVASTMAAQPPGPLLLVMAGVTLGQICIGAFFGRALAPLVDGQYSRDRTILGWHPMNPARSAAAIAASVGTATGVPLAAQALLPRTKAPPEGTRQLVALAAAFGNSFTLPAVFFMTLLPPALADRALGYAAIFMLFWSPALWSLGYAMVLGGPDTASQPPLPLTSPAAAAASSGSGGGNGSGGSLSSSQVGPCKGPAGMAPKQSLLTGEQQQQQGKAVGPAAVPEGLRRIAAGPDWEVVEGFEAGQPISFPPPNSGGSAAADGSGSGQSGQPHRHLAAFDHVMQYQVFRALRQSIGQVLNPPVLGILAGMAVGLTPWGRALLASVRSGAAAGAALPPELGLMQAVLRHALEVVELLAGGTLAVQTLVLAASLLQQQQSSAFPGGFGTTSSVSSQAFLPPGSGAVAAGGASSNSGGEGSGSSSGLGRGVLRAVKRALLPADGVEERALAVLTLTRFVLVPLGTLGLLWCLHALGLLRAASDPVLLFVLLVEAVMPSAQNLIILLQLSERTRKVAPSFAALLLKLYAYAVLPCTLWVTAFATRLAIPVLR